MFLILEYKAKTTNIFFWARQTQKPWGISAHQNTQDFMSEAITYSAVVCPRISPHFPQFPNIPADRILPPPGYRHNSFVLTPRTTTGEVGDVLVTLDQKDHPHFIRCTIHWLKGGPNG